MSTGDETGSATAIHAALRPSTTGPDRCADPRGPAAGRPSSCEGVTGRAFADKAWLPRHWRGWVQRAIDGVLFTTADLLTDASPPVSLRDAVGQAAPRPVLLVAGGGVVGNAEEDADRWIQAGSPDTVEIWVAPDTAHTAALHTHPRQWEARVIGFLDSALLQ